MCAAYFGMTPAQVDECSFRDLNAMLAGAVDRERSRREADMERTLLLAQAVMNGYSKPRPLDYMIKKMKQPKGQSMSLEEYRKRRDAALAKVAERNGNSRKA